MKLKKNKVMNFLSFITYKNKTKTNKLFNSLFKLLFKPIVNFNIVYEVFSWI